MKLTFIVLTAVLFDASSWAASQHGGYAGETWFQQAWQTEETGVASDELTLIKHGCGVVSSSTPQERGYVDGIAACAAAYQHLGYWLKSEDIYKQARRVTQHWPNVSIRLAIAHALLLAGELRQTASVASWKEVLLLEDNSPHKSDLYSAELIYLALQQEATGYPEDAEATYRAALAQPRSDLRSWPRPTFFTPLGRQGNLPIWDPRKAFIGFLMNRGRMAEAMQSAHEGVVAEHDPFYALLYTLSEISISRKDPSLRKAGLTDQDLTHLTRSAMAHLPAWNEARAALAYALSDVGKPADAQAVLRATSFLVFGHSSQASAAAEGYQERSQLAKASGKTAEAHRLSRLASYTRNNGTVVPDTVVGQFDEIVEGFNDGWGQPRPVPIDTIRKAMSLLDGASGSGCIGLVDQLLHLVQWNPEPDQTIVLDWSIREVSRLTGPVSDRTILALCGLAFPNHPEVLQSIENLVRSTRGEQSSIEFDVVWRKIIFGRSRNKSFELELTARRDLLERKAAMYGTQSEDVAEDYARMAQFCDQLGHSDRSLDLWMKSLEISRKSSAGHGRYYAFNLDRAGLFIARQGNFAQALAWNDEAMAATKYSPGLRDEASKVRTEILQLQEKASIR